MNFGALKSRDILTCTVLPELTALDLFATLVYLPTLSCTNLPPVEALCKVICHHHYLPLPQFEDNR